MKRRSFLHSLAALIVAPSAVEVLYERTAATPKYRHTSIKLLRSRKVSPGHEFYVNTRSLDKLMKEIYSEPLARSAFNEAELMSMLTEREGRWVTVKSVL